MPLTTDQVNAAYSSIKSRGQNVIDSLESKKTFFGDVTGNNDTVTQTQGAVRMIITHQIDGWRDNGLDLASQGDSADPGKVKGWVNVGKDFTTAISEIDGYGEDAALQSVIIATVKQTAKDAVPFAFGFGIGLVGVAVLAAGIMVFVYLRPLR